jgi:hypothetical protein
VEEEMLTRVKEKEPWEMTREEYKKAPIEQIEKNTFVARYSNLSPEIQKKVRENYIKETGDTEGANPKSKEFVLDNWYWDKETGKVFGDDVPTHKQEVENALKKGKLSSKQYNKLHAKDYGEWGSEKFKRNFPNMVKKEKDSEKRLTWKEAEQLKKGQVLYLSEDVQLVGNKEYPKGTKVKVIGKDFLWKRIRVKFPDGHVTSLSPEYFKTKEVQKIKPTATPKETELPKPLYKDSFGRDVIIIDNKKYHLDTEFANKKGKWGVLHEVEKHNVFTGRKEKMLDWFLLPIYPSRKQAIIALTKQVDKQKEKEKELKKYTIKPKYKIGDTVRVINPYGGFVKEGKITDISILERPLPFSKASKSKVYYEIDNKGSYAEDILELVKKTEKQYVTDGTVVGEVIGEELIGKRKKPAWKVKTFEGIQWIFKEFARPVKKSELEGIDRIIKAKQKINELIDTKKTIVDDKAIKKAKKELEKIPKGMGYQYDEFKKIIRHTEKLLKEAKEKGFKNLNEYFKSIFSPELVKTYPSLTLKGAEYAWDKKKWRPIISKRVIRRGNYKGKVEVIFPDKKKAIVDKVRNLGGINMDKNLKTLLFLGFFAGLAFYINKSTSLSGLGNSNISLLPTVSRIPVLGPVSRVPAFRRYGMAKAEEERKLTHYFNILSRGSGLVRR